MVELPPLKRAALALLLALVAGAALAAVPAPPSAGLELEWLQAVGFPAWALVLLFLGNRVIRQVQSLSDKLHDHVIQVERRIAHLEALMQEHR